MEEGRGATDIDCAKRRAKPDQAGPHGSQNHAATRGIEQLAQMLYRVRLHRSLPQDFVATLELAGESPQLAGLRPYQFAALIDRLLVGLLRQRRRRAASRKRSVDLN